MTVAITSVNALPHAGEIKELFLAHGRDEFPDFFDRSYPCAIANGAASWIGRDPDGRLVMHIACFPRRFALGSRPVVGGLMVNLMVAQPYRSFFPALSLLRQLIRDAKARGVVDFLYADPNEESRALLRGTRFVTLGTLKRYVLPVGHPRPLVDLAVRSVHAWTWLAGGTPRPATVIPHAAARFSVQRFAAPQAQSGRVVAFHDLALYESRLAGYPGDRDWWVTVHRGATTRPEAALLVRGPDPSGLAVLHALRLAPDLPLASVLPGLITELRNLGCERLQVSTVAESELGRTLRRCGFVPRSEAVPLFALPLTSLGEECIRSVKDWEITDLECDR